MVALKCNLMIGISISINIEMKTENLKIEGVNYLIIFLDQKRFVMIKLPQKREWVWYETERSSVL